MNARNPKSPGIGVDPSVFYPTRIFLVILHSYRNFPRSCHSFYRTSIEFYKTLKNNLRTIRDAKRLTLKQLAHKSGRYAWQTIGAYEKSDRRLTQEFLENMSQVLEVSIEEIQPAEVEVLREEAASYAAAFSLQVLPPATLHQVVKSLVDEMHTAEGERYRSIVQSLSSAADELRRRLSRGVSSKADLAAAELLAEAERYSKQHK